MNERVVLRADALLDLAVGVLLLLAPWDGLYAALDLPHAKPELFVQVAGGLLVAFAYLLWVAPTAEVLTRQVALVAAVANALAVVLIVGWLVAGGLGIGALGSALLIAVAAALALFAGAEALIARAG